MYKHISRFSSHPSVIVSFWNLALIYFSRGNKLWIWIQQILCSVWFWWNSQLWYHTHCSGSPWSGEVSYPGQPWEIWRHRQWVQTDRPRRRYERIGQRMGTHSHWLLSAGALQVWFLWSFQDCLWKRYGRGNKCFLLVKKNYLHWKWSEQYRMQNESSNFPDWYKCHKNFRIVVY